MMNLKKKGKVRLLVGALLLVLNVGLLAGCGNTNNAGNNTGNDDAQETYTLKFAHVVNANTPKGVAANRFKEIVEEKSEGRLLIDVYPDSQLGNDQEINEQILAGTIDMNAPFFPTLTSFIEEFELFDLPYLFENNDDAYAALEGELGDKFNEYLDEIGFRGLGYWTGGFKELTNSIKPIKTTEDLDGLKMRVSQSAMLVSQYRILNAGGISVPFAELYTALQTHTVDGQENSLANIASKKFYEVQDYLTISDHGFMGYAFLINKEKFNSLPEDLQTIIDEAALEVGKEQWEMTAEKEVEYLEEIKAAGVQVDEFSEDEKANFLEITGSVYDEFKELENGAELLEVLGK
ncbi:TRAP transporter substrate-binding protein [Clostridium sp. DL1XJH146]